MQKILMLLTSHRLDCFSLNIDLLLNGPDITSFDRVVLMLNGVEGKHKAYVEHLLEKRKDIPWDTVSGPRGKKEFVANLQNEVVKRYPDSLYFKIDEDVYFSKGCVPKLLAAYEAFKDDPDLALITPVIPNNALGAHHLLTRFPALGAEYKERFGEEINADFNGPVWRRPDIAEWLIREFLDMDAANTRLAKEPVEPVYQRFSHRFSINCLVYDERHWQAMGGIPNDEEPAWTQWVPDNGKFNVLCTDTLMQHYSFFVQQDWLDRSSILEDLRRANLPKHLHPSPIAAGSARAGRLLQQAPRAIKRKIGSLTGSK